MSKFFTLKSLYFQYCTIAALYFVLFITNFFTLTGEKVGFITTFFIIFTLLYYLFLIYKLFKKLILVVNQTNSENKYLKNKWLPLLNAFPITAIIFNPITIFQIGKEIKSKLINFKLFNQLSIFNLAYTCVSTIYLIFSISVLKQNESDIGIYGIFNNIILTFLPIYLIGVLVFTFDNKKLK